MKSLWSWRLGLQYLILGLGCAEACVHQPNDAVWTRGGGGGDKIKNINKPLAQGSETSGRYPVELWS